MRGAGLGLVVIALILLSTVASAGVAVGQSAGGVGWERTCTVHIVAVSSGGGGVLSNLTVTVRYPGSGKVYISTSPASEVDTQGSARLAAVAASIVVGVSVEDYDFYYDIMAPSIIIGGPSAGAEMALATLLLLLGEPCNQSIVATGMIQPDTTIGPVGGLKEKLEAAASHGMKVFVVPAGQLVYTYYEERIVRRGPFVWVTREPVTVNLSSLGEQLGIHVYEAGSLLDLYYIATRGSPPPLQTVTLNISRLPGWMSNTIQSWVGATLESVNSTLQAYTGGSLASLRDEALGHAANASRSLARGDLYRALMEAGRALAGALLLNWTLEALENDLDVTGPVEETVAIVNATLQSLESTGEPPSIEALQLQLLASGLAARASYKLSTGLDQLEREGDRYRLPSFLFTVDISGLRNITEAYALARVASLLANISSNTTGTSSGWDWLPGRSLLLESTAKTAVAYLDTLLREAGGSTPLLGAAEYAVSLSISSGSPILRMGASLEAINLVAEAIHSVFHTPLDRPAMGIGLVLASRDDALRTPALSLLLNTPNLTLDRLTTALLLQWATTPPQQAGNPTSPPSIPTAPPHNPGEGGGTPVATPQLPGPGGEGGESQGGQAWSGTLGVAIVVAAILVLVVLVVVEARRGSRGASLGVS